MTKQRMKNAHFARTLDTDTDFNKFGEEYRGNEYGWRTADRDGTEHYRLAYAEQMQEKYASGKEVLKSYILTYSRSFVVGTHSPELPKGTVCTLVVDGGRTATEKATRLAIFRKRKAVS